MINVLNGEKNFKVSKTIISRKDKKEKKRIIHEIKSFLKQRKHTRKIHHNKHKYKNHTRKNKKIIHEKNKKKMIINDYKRL